MALSLLLIMGWRVRSWVQNSFAVCITYQKKKKLRNSSIFLCYHSLWFWDILKDFIGRFINRFFKIMRIFYGRTSSMYRRKGSSRVFLLGWCAACRWCHAIKKKLTLVKKYLLIIICKCTICFAHCVLLFGYSLLWCLELQLYFITIFYIWVQNSRRVLILVFR